MERIYLTPEGQEKLIKELEYHKNTKRKEIALALNHARSLGDLSENAEYDAAKEAFATNEHRIRELEDRLACAEVIEHKNLTTETVCMGVTVKLFDMDTETEVKYIIVGQDEANPVEDRISLTSPVAQALLGKKPGEIVDIHVPAGVLKYKVINISRG
jgi:transcription elongation factor GreA